MNSANPLTMQAFIYYSDVQIVLRHGLMTSNLHEELVGEVTIYPGAFITDRYFFDGKVTWDMTPYILADGTHDNTTHYEPFNSEHDLTEPDVLLPVKVHQFQILPVSRLVGKCTNTRTKVTSAVAVPNYQALELDISDDAESMCPVTIGYQDQVQLMDIGPWFVLIGTTFTSHGVSVPDIQCACVNREFDGHAPQGTMFWLCSARSNSLRLISIFDPQVPIVGLRVNTDSRILLVMQYGGSSELHDYKLVVVTELGTSYLVSAKPYWVIRLNPPGKVTELCRYACDRLMLVTQSGRGYHHWSISNCDTPYPRIVEYVTNVISSSMYSRVTYPLVPRTKSARSNVK